MGFHSTKLMMRAALAGCALGLLPLLPASAQDGIGMRQILGSIGILPGVDREPIEYRDRPTLVVPRDTTLLRNPEDPEAHERKPSWPVDPDVTERRKEQARRRAPAPELLAGQSVDGRRVSMEEIRAGRAPVGAQMTEGNWGNDKAGIRLSPSEWAAGTPVNQPTYAPGTEPPRRYLTDPPKGLRQAATGAPMRRTQEAPQGFDNNRPDDTWRRLD
ncbi:hypothetical protein [Rhabdaerophilum sp.]|uniref:hypothetical protein n=1 Tax=Rhabdaerophilum sp. TaxID=2717341 RepID=UPI0038D4240D